MFQLFIYSVVIIDLIFCTSIVVACRLNIRCMCTQTKIHMLCNFLYVLWKYEKDDAENVHTMLDIYCEHLQQR